MVASSAADGIGATSIRTPPSVNEDDRAGCEVTVAASAVVYAVDARPDRLRVPRRRQHGDLHGLCAPLRAARGERGGNDLDGARACRGGGTSPAVPIPRERRVDRSGRRPDVLPPDDPRWASGAGRRRRRRRRGDGGRAAYEGHDGASL